MSEISYYLGTEVLTDWFGISKTGSCLGETSTSMLRGEPGWRLMRPARVLGSTPFGGQKAGTPRLDQTGIDRKGFAADQTLN
jgi:hypothetical protein